MIKKFKELPALIKQLIIAGMCAVLFVILVLVFFFAIRPVLIEMAKPVTYSTEIIDGKRVYKNDKTGELIWELLDGEEVLTFGTNHRILIAPKVLRADMKNIQVKNSGGSYKLVHHLGEGYYYIEGAELVPINQETVSSFFVEVGYLLSMERVAAANIGDGNEILADLSPFGLDPTEECPYFIVTTTGNDWYKIIIGDKIPTTGGYYVMYEDKNGVRPAIYILHTNMESTVLSEKYALMYPIIAEQIPQNQIYFVDNFKFYKGSDSDLLVEIYNAPAPEDYAIPVNYQMRYPAPYLVDDNGYGTLLSAFVSFAGERVVYTFDMNEEEADEEAYQEVFRSFGFDEPSAKITFDLYESRKTGEDANGEDIYELFFDRDYNFIFSKKNENGNYYIMSFDYGSIVEITPAMLTPQGERLPFIEWDLLKFVNKSIFSQNIYDAETIRVKIPGEDDAVFELEGSSSDDFVVKGNGTILDIPTFRSYYYTMLTLVLIDYGRDIYETDDLLLLELIITNKDGFERDYKFYFVEGNTSRSFYRLNGSSDFYVEYDRVLKLKNDTERMLQNEFIDREAKE